MPIGLLTGRVQGLGTEMRMTLRVRVKSWVNGEKFWVFTRNKTRRAEKTMNGERCERAILERNIQTPTCRP